MAHCEGTPSYHEREIEMLAENLRAAITSRDTFLSIASHELNTPLTTLKLQVQMHARLLERQDPRALACDPIQRLFAHTYRQVRRLERLVGDMLDVSRIDNGKLSVHCEDFDLSALVIDLIARLEPQLSGAQMQTSCRVPTRLWVHADPARIEQVLTNLTVNATRYAPNSCLTVALVAADAQVTATVVDTGPGIDPRHQQRIFGRFERATDASKASGLGLGLYICKQLLSEQGSSLTLHSTVGESAAFGFSLAAAAPN